MTRPMLRQLLVTLLAAAVLAAPAAGTLGAGPLRPQQRREMSALAKQALADDPQASWEAIQALRDMGEPASGRLAGVLRQLLERGRKVIGRASRMVSDPARAAELQNKLGETRAKALANIKVLEKGKPIALAHEYYDQLEQKVTLLAKVFEVRQAVRRVMIERGRILPIWRGLDAKDLRFNEANEADLAKTAEGILGMPVEEVTAIGEFGEGPAPEAGSTGWHYWHHAACRAIEAYNAGLKSLMSAAEYDNVRAVNHYRELLGILPLEADARLLQSARRHSKEMVDLGYFSHESPKAEHKTFGQRAKRAGYHAACAENIADGYPGGEKAFWGWFESPGHHKNMAAEGSTALGVGRWGRKWTQNFGGGKRLMLLEEDARRQVAVKGDALPPQG
ncbi:MAG: CAP domain-containing protein [Phycisphaerae bacterium]